MVSVRRNQNLTCGVGRSQSETKEADDPGREIAYVELQALQEISGI